MTQSLLEKIAHGIGGTKKKVGLTKVAQNPTVAAEAASEVKKGVPSVPEKSLSNQVALKVDDKQTRFLSPEMVSMLNEQIGFEMLSAYLYFMMAAWSQSKGLTGFQAHFQKQGEGEVCHGMKVYKYLVDTGSKVEIPAVPSTSKLINFSNMQEACRAALDHEMVVTRRWQVIGEKAKAEPNLATQELAAWFMTEQVEEEDLSMTLLNKVELADSGAGLLIIDAGLK